MLFALLLLPPVLAPDEDLPARVRMVLAENCGKCHGPIALKPKAGINYITDLNRLTANPALITPGNPETSRVWQLVTSGDMPPAPEPAMTPLGRATLYQWIATGAAADGVAPAPDLGLSAAPVASLQYRLFSWIGRFHVVLIHFPIALLIVAGFLEAWTTWGPCHEPWLCHQVGWSSTRCCLVLGTVGALVTATTGWVHYLTGGHGYSISPLLSWHRAGGTILAVLAVLTTTMDLSQFKRTWDVRVSIWLTAVVAGITAHWGGLMVHGASFFSF